MTDVPPLLEPYDHQKPNVETDLSSTFSIKLYGASGIPINIAPLPIIEGIELPLMFEAIIITLTLDPKFKLNGDIIKL